MAYFFDNTMLAHAANNDGDLSGVFSGQVFSQVCIFKATDHEFAPQDDAKKFKVIVVEQVESTVGAVVGPHGLGYFVEPFNAIGGIVDGGEKLDVAAVGVEQELDEILETVNAFLHRRELEGGGSVAVYYLAVVFEKRDVVGGCLDAQHDAVFVVHFNGGFSHVVFDSGALNAGMKIVAEFILVVAGKFASQKRGDIVGFNGMGGGADQFVIKWSEVLLTFEYDVGGVFNLHEAPMVAIGELVDDGTVGFDGVVQQFVQTVWADGVGEFLSRRGIFDVNKGVVKHFVADAFLVKFARQFVVAVVVKLQPERRPGGYAQITQTQVRQDKIEVIVQTLSRCVFKEGFLCFFVVPRLIGRTRLHRGEDMHQARMSAAFGDDGLDAFFLAKIIFGDEFNFQTVVSRDGFSVLTQCIAQLVGPLGKIENPDIVVVEPAGRGARIANIHQGAVDNHTVVARKRKRNLICMAFNKITHGNSMKQNCGKRHVRANMAA